MYTNSNNERKKIATMSRTRVTKNGAKKSPSRPIASSPLSIIVVINQLYIDDIPHVTSLLSIIFADDTNLFCSARTMDDCITKINSELISLSRSIMLCVKSFGRTLSCLRVLSATMLSGDWAIFSRHFRSLMF